MVARLSWQFGALIGVMWMAEVTLANLGGTPVLGSLGAFRGLAPLFALAAVACTMLGGYAAAHRTGSMRSAIYVGIWSGLISGAILFVTLMSITVAFHSAMMLDPSNVHEFARSAHRPPTSAELSSFLYRDALGGAVNHLWIGPLLGVTVGAAGAVAGLAARPVPTPTHPESTILS